MKGGGAVAVEAVWVALIVATAGVASTLLLSHLQSRQRRREKAEDYARQDAVAERLTRRQDAVAAKVAEAATQAAEAAELLLAANERVAAQTAEADRATQARLQQIHVLVNSNLTEAQERELEATRGTLVSMREVVALSRKLGLEPAPDSLRQIESTEARIDILARNLAHKIQQTAVADGAAEPRQQ